MIEPYKSHYLEPSKQYRRFSLLLCISKKPDVSQKLIGKQTCLSSSMVNNYIKELLNDGLLQISGTSNRSMTYHLTDKGKEYLSTNFLLFSAEIVQFYASVRREISAMLTGSYQNGIRSVVLYGASDTAEIVYSAIQTTSLVIKGVVDSDRAKIGKLFYGITIQSPTKINKIKPDALILTSFARQNEILNSLKGNVDKNIQIKMISSM